MLTLVWALSLAALCVPLAQKALPADAPGWTRTLPDTGAWFLAALALGLGYRYAGRQPRLFARPRLWLLALLLAGVSTLGESFANTGTAALVTSQKWLALLYFAGRVPAYYLGFALLLDALRKPSTGLEHPARHDAEESGLFADPTNEEWNDDRPRLRSARLTGARAGASNVRPLPAASESGALFAAPPADRRAAPVDSPMGDRRNGPRQGTTRPVGSGRHGAMAAGARRPATVHMAAAQGGRDAAYQAYRDTEAEPPYRYPTGRRRGVPTVAFMLLLLACWLPYLVAVWPGTVSNDSIAQLAQALGLTPLSNGNPLAQTGLIWLFVQAGMGIFGTADAAVALYVCVQAALMAWLFGYALSRIHRSRAPRWLTWVAAAFFALNPVFPTFAFCVGKDTNFAMAVLWLTLMVWRVLESRWPPLRTLVGLTLSGVACVLLRNAGLGVAVVTLGALLIWSLTVRTRQWRAPLTALAASVLAALALNLLVVPALGALPTPDTESWSVPLQQVARVVASEPVTAEERAAIDAVMPFDQIQPAYNGELSDPVKALWREGTAPEQRTAFFATWLRLGLKHPATYLSATFHNTYGYLLPGYVSTIKPTLLMGMEGRATLLGGAFNFTVNPLAQGLKSTLQGLYAYPPFRLLVAPGAYGWVVLLALAGAMGVRQRRYAVAMLPALVVLAGCMLSAVNGYFRYAMPLYCVAPVLLAMLAQGLASGYRGRV